MGKVRVLPWFIVPVLGVAIGFGGCGKGKQAEKADTNAPPTQSQTAEVTPPPAATPQPATTPPPAQTPPAGEVKKAPPPKHEAKAPLRPPAPVIRDFTVATGAALTVALGQELTTKDMPNGTPFTAQTKEPVVVDGTTVIPAGSTIHGVVTQSEKAPRLGGSSHMTVSFASIELANGESYAIQAQPVQFEGKSSTKGDIEKVVGGAVGGGVLGGVLGGKKGAAKGAAAGTIAGGVWAAATRGTDLYVTPGTEIKVTLSQDLKIPVKTGGRS